MKRTIVIGDIHGCCDEFLELLTKCRWTATDDLVLVGDLVAKGPDSKGVVEQARALGARAVLGNHDAHVLRAREVQQGKRPPGDRPIKPDHKFVLDTLGAEDFAYLENLPYFLRLGPERPGEPDTLIVHAGFVPGVPIELQRPEDMMNLRSILPDGKASKKLDGRPWAEVWPGPERVVFGHDAVRGLQQHAFATGLDTGCVYGRELTALILPDRELVSVSAHKTYMPMSA